MLARSPQDDDSALDMDPASAPEQDTSTPEARAARLARDLADATEQNAATSEGPQTIGRPALGLGPVLQTSGRSAFELEPVFETVVHHAVRLCHADAGQIYRLDGDVYRLVTAV